MTPEERKRLRELAEKVANPGIYGPNELEEYMQAIEPKDVIALLDRIDELESADPRKDWLDMDKLQRGEPQSWEPKGSKPE